MDVFIRLLIVFVVVFFFTNWINGVNISGLSAPIKDMNFPDKENVSITLFC